MTETPRPFRSVPTPQSKPGETAAPTVPPKPDPHAAAPATTGDLPPERGGYAGPEPTRFGDWEHKGRCTDF